MPRRFDHLADLEAFQRSVELGSFSAAAQALGATPSSVSRAVNRLEARLGVALLRRTTRRLALTDAGRAYFDASRAALAAIDDAERALQGDAQRVRGRLRLSVPTTWALASGYARLAAFLERHPGVRLELCVTGRNVDLVAEGFDAAVRLGAPPDSGFVARPLAGSVLCLVASPAYLARHGVPVDLAALAAHPAIGFQRPSTGKPLPWALVVDGKPLDWVPKARILVSDDPAALLHLAEAGAGIAQTFENLAAPRIADGRLVEVLPSTRGRERGFALVYARQRHPAPALRALVDHLCALDAARPAPRSA